VTIQIANLGGTYPFVLDRLDTVNRRDRSEGQPTIDTTRIFFDTASFSSRSIGLALDVFSPEQVLYGTDCPIFDLETPLKAIREMPISDDQKNAILSGTMLIGCHPSQRWHLSLSIAFNSSAERPFGRLRSRFVYFPPRP